MVKYIHVYDHLGCCNNSVSILSDFQSYIVSRLEKAGSLIFLKKSDKNNIELQILILYIYDYVLCFCLSLKIFQHQFEYVWVILNYMTYILQVAFIVPSLPPCPPPQKKHHGLCLLERISYIFQLKKLQNKLFIQ